MPTPTRPTRPRLPDETGQWRTLGTGPEAFDAFGAGPEPVLLGLGPDPAVAAALLPPGVTADYVECPQFVAAMPETWQAAISERLRPLDPAALTPERVARSRFFLYRQNLRLYPTFWGRVLARIRLVGLPGPAARNAGTGPVLLVRPEAGLLEPELARALTDLGRVVTEIPAGADPADLARAIAAIGPALYLCVNGAGLDADGLAAGLLAEAGVPAAVWCVDNPFHILSRFRAPWWKALHLFVTDDWFCQPLRALGAASVHHLPLAASRHFFQTPPVSDPIPGVLFVGRSAFPDRDGFFAGCRPPQSLLDAALTMLARGERPDFGWWIEHLGITSLWPGKAVRLAGCGAETTNLAWRGDCLSALARAVPLAMHGDTGWQGRVPGATLHGPVDYYGGLAGCYAGTAVTVNLTSLLLPRGLTQRHFDVWAAGGCLITDATPGLALFPEELTRPIAFSRTAEAARLAKELLGDPARRQALGAAWRDHLATGHTYAHRLVRLLDVVRDATCS